MTANDAAFKNRLTPNIRRNPREGGGLFGCEDKSHGEVSRPRDTDFPSLLT
jgi:hypothetical protein